MSGESSAGPSGVSDEPNAAPRVLRALARWVSTSPKVVLAVCAVFVVLSGVAARHVRLDNNFAQLFDSNAADADFRVDYRDTFGADDGLLVAVLEAPDSFDPTTSSSLLDVVDELTSRLAGTGDGSGMSELASVTSATNVFLAWAPASERDGGFGTVAKSPFAAEPAEAVAALRESRLGGANLISEDGRTALVIGELDKELNSYEAVVDPAEEFEATVRDAIRDSDNSLADDIDVTFGGVTYTRIAAISEMQTDLLKLFPLSTLAMIVLLWWFFRRVVAVVAPLMAITMSLVGTAGLIGLAGDDLNQVTIIYPVLLMGVVVATATHVVHRFYIERAAGADAATAARVTLERITRAAIVSSVTNAIGFASLALSKMLILREFGLYVAFGVVLCFFATSLVIPALLVITDAEPPAWYTSQPATVVPGVSDGASRARSYASKLTAPGVSNLVVIGGVVLVALSVWQATTASYDYSLSGMLNADRPVSHANQVIDDDLNGLVPIEISLNGNPGDFLDNDDVLGRLEEFDTKLALLLNQELARLDPDRPDVDVKPTSLAGVVDAARTVSGNPDLSPSGALALIAQNDATDKAIRTLVTEDDAWARVRAFFPDVGSTKIVELANRIDELGYDVFAGSGVEVTTTGEAPVAYRGMNDLTGELVNSTLVAMALIVVAIGIAFGSIGLSIVALLPNVVPITVGLAAYSLERDTLDPVAGLVFCIAMGLAADDTIHLMNRMRELRPRYESSGEALVAAFVSVRRAMVSSTVVLVAAFLSLAVSGFPTNQTIGVLGAFVLGLALASDSVFGAAALAVLGRRQDDAGRNIDGTPLDVSES